MTIKLKSQKVSHLCAKIDKIIEITLSSGDEVDLKSLPLQVARPEGDNVMSTPS